MKMFDDHSALISGRHFSAQEIHWIQTFIQSNPSLSRRALSIKVCEHLQWLNPMGKLKDMRMRVVMLEMHRAGLLELPSPRCKWVKKDPSTQASSSQRILALDFSSSQPIQEPVHLLGPLRLEVVSSETPTQLALWNQCIQAHHYLGHTTIVGAQIKYNVFAQNTKVALISFGSPAWRCKCRDDYIGWSEQQRKNKLQSIVNNTRFLILPWVKSKNLASKILATMAKELPRDWLKQYGCKPLFMETFVDKKAFYKVKQ